MTTLPGIRTLALTQQEMAFLRIALRVGLPEEIHAIVTSGLESKYKTAAIMAVVDNFSILSEVLTWRASDEVRAYRQLNLDGVIKIREIMAGIDPAQLPNNMLRNAHKALAPTIAQALQRAMDSEAERQMSPVSIDKPTAKA